MVDKIRYTRCTISAYFWILVQADFCLNSIGNNDAVAVYTN